MPSRLPGLTPAAHGRLHDTLASIPGLRDGITHISPDALLCQVTDAVLDALPPVPSNATIAILVRRLQGMSDDLRRDGKPGMARDIDLLSGTLHGLALERQALLDRQVETDLGAPARRVPMAARG